MGRKPSKDVKYEVLKTSFEYLVQNGLENTSVRDLCKAVGISSGSLYYWFDGKDDIYISVAQYGLARVAEVLFDFAFGTIQNLEKFFEESLDAIDKVKMELRFIYQVAASPVYGERMRLKADALHVSYSRYVSELSKKLGCTEEILRPVVFMYISVILDYVVWEDKSVSQMQLKYLYGILDKKLINDSNLGVKGGKNEG